METSFFSSFLKDDVADSIIIFWLFFFFFLVLYCHFTAFWTSFWPQIINIFWYCGSSVHSNFSVAIFTIFSLFWLLGMCVGMMYLGMDSLCFVIWGLLSFSWNLKRFWLFFQIFAMSLSPLYFWNSLSMLIGLLDILSQVFGVLFIFLHSFYFSLFIHQIG